MASLANQTISSTYDGLIKTSSDNAVPVSGVQALEDGSGNALALSVGRSGNGVTVSGNLAVDTNTLYVDAANNRVGIGTSSPAAVLEVNNDTDGETVAIFEGRYAAVSDVTLASFQRNGGAVAAAVKYADASTAIEFGTTTGHSLILTTGATERMRIDSSGNVIIQSGFLRIQDGSAAAPSLNVGIDVDTGLFRPTTNTIGFTTAGSERMRIDSSGNVGINCTPSSILHTVGVGGAASSPIIEASTTTNYVGLKIKQNGDFWIAKDNSVGSSFSTAPYANVLYGSGAHPMVFSTNATERMRITSGGNVLINTDVTPDASNGGFGVFASGGSTYIYNSTEQSSSWFHLQFINPNGIVGSINTNGSATTFNTSSDYRLKENVVPMEGALDRVDALKPSRFNFIADPEKTVDGFLAHEVQAIVPEAVTGEKDGVDEEGNPIYQGIDQSKIVPLLVGAIQELKAEIELLKSQING